MGRGEALYLWLLADGLHKNMMTSRILENRKRQKASSIHSSLQSYKSSGEGKEVSLKVYEFN